MPVYTTDSEGSTGRRQVTVALAVFGLAVVLTYLPPGQQQAIAATLRTSVLRPFVATQEGLLATRERAVQSGRLRARLDSLVAIMTSRGTAVEENRRLRALLSLRRRVGTAYQPASVIRAGTAGSESMFMLDVGEAEGVRPNAPVVTRHGLLGVVRQVRGGTAIGMDWTHPDFRASAMTLDGATYGIVASRRGDFREDDRLVLNGTPFHTSLDEGTVIVTSGLGGVYPRGVPIGTVAELAEAEAGWRKSYWLRPLVSPGGATHVLVATAAEDGSAPPGDLSSAWPEDSILSYETLAARERARRDSLAALGDSVLILRQLLMAYQGQDSAALAALDAAARDSILRAARRARAAAAARSAPDQSAAPLAPPTAGAARDAGSGGQAPPGLVLPPVERVDPSGVLIPPMPDIQPIAPPLDTTGGVPARPDTTPPPRDTLRAGSSGRQGGVPST